jgi:hypothetical protein
VEGRVKARFGDVLKGEFSRPAIENASDRTEEVMTREITIWTNPLESKFTRKMPNNIGARCADFLSTQTISTENFLYSYRKELASGTTTCPMNRSKT